MANIKQITLPSGNTYDLVDAGARDLIAQLQANGKYLGVTTTALTEGSTTNPITIAGKSVTAKAGDWVILSGNKKEFIFNGTSWQEFGDMSNLGSLAYEDSASGTVTDYVTGASSSFKGTAATLKLTPAGSIALTNSNKTATVSAASSGTVTYTPAGSNASSTVSGSCSVTATGSVSAPTISVATAGTTTSVYSITAVGTLPTLTTTVENEVLTIGFNQGTLPTKGSKQTVKTGDASYTASAPTFTGTMATGTINGTADAQTFTGTGARLVTGNIAVPTSASFSGTEGSISYTPAGSVTTTLTKGNKTITVS